MNVELRQLRYFVTVADELHFSRSAERLHIAQPALSQQIRKLENEIGVSLFHRTKRRVELSAAGEAMLRPARQAIAEAERAVDVARRADRGEVGHLTIGFVESAAMDLVPRAVRRFRLERPRVDVSLRELAVEAQIDGLRSGVLDVGILRQPADTAGLELATVAEEGLVVVTADAHPLAKRRRVSAPSLVDEPLVLLSREMVPGLYDQIVALQHKHGGANIAQEATSIQAVLGLVAAGLGISLLPASVKSLAREGVSFVDLSVSPRSRIEVAWRESDRSPLTAAFIRAAQLR
jgi:DNA-binding transcriptional LysR family regulator